ncbi:Polymeric immunoglobulin receptor [Gossypium arboreum]|uniref:Polymeric immunoglobulin receptor n=1 Tax=Gossypium arboreum TaxID=29729 RepID=A0A0B0PPH4_GOSAR|nr:Polymeric immunoglobulin receptor [Gossypium arboreum]
MTKKRENRIWIGEKLKVSTSHPVSVFHHPRFWIKLRARGSSIKPITLSIVFDIL